MSPKTQFEKHGAILVKDVIDKNLANFFTHVLLRSPNYGSGQSQDPQVVGSLGLMHHEVMFETAHEKIWSAVENILEEELIPTYAYARAYTNGNELKKHTDRPACEVSVTVQLGRSHHYAWPIFMGNQRFDLAEGDGVIYQGCNIEHWRNVCDGPDNYISGQVFFHFVKANGGHAKEIYDKRWGATVKPYVRNRNFFLEHK